MTEPIPRPDPASLEGPLGRRALVVARRAAFRHWVASARYESKLKIAVVAGGALALLGGAWLLARLAFDWLADFGGAIVGAEQIAQLLTAKLLSLAAAALFVLLATSSIAVSFGSMFRSRELPLLIASPLPTRELVRARARESVVLASWASAFLSAPIALAWGQSIGAPLVLYPLALALYLPFALLAGCLGIAVMLTLTRVFARRPVSPLVVIALVLIVGLFRVARRVVRSLDVDQGVDLSALLAVVGRTESPYLPSSWLAEGILAASRGELAGVGLPALLLYSWSMLAFVAVLALGERWFAPIWADLVDRGAAGEARRSRPLLGGRRLEGLLGALMPRAMAQLAIKDLRTFWRDPAQWSQFAVFFGLLAVYLATMRTSLGGYDTELWHGLATLLNTGAGLLVLATLTTRFVFPSVGIEGRRFWLLGLAPLPRRNLVAEKMVLALLLVTPLPLLLALFAGLRLGLDGLAMVVSLVVVIASAFALSGIAVGLGCLLPSFDEEDSARIVSGFGGTLTFVASLLWILLATAVQTLIVRWSTVASAFDLTWSRGQVALAAMVLLLLLAAGAAALPLRLGVRRLERLEV